MLANNSTYSDTPRQRPACHNFPRLTVNDYSAVVANVMFAPTAYRLNMVPVTVARLKARTFGSVAAEAHPRVDIV